MPISGSLGVYVNSVSEIPSPIVDGATFYFSVGLCSLGRGGLKEGARVGGTILKRKGR